MHSAGRRAQVVNHHVWTVFTETVREDSIVRRRTTQIEDGPADRLQTPDSLHRYFFPGIVLHLDLDGPVGMLIVNLQYISQVGFAIQAAASHRHLMTRSKLIVESRLRRLPPRVVA